MTDDTERFASCRIGAICDVAFPLLSTKTVKPDLIPFPVIMQRLLLKSVLKYAARYTALPHSLHPANESH